MAGPTGWNDCSQATEGWSSGAGSRIPGVGRREGWSRCKRNKFVKFRFILTFIFLLLPYLNERSHKIFELRMDPEIMDRTGSVVSVIPWIPEKWMMDYELSANLVEDRVVCQGNPHLEVLRAYLTSRTSFHVSAVREGIRERRLSRRRGFHRFWHRSWLFAGDYKFPMQS